MTWTIGAAAKIAKVSVRTLHHYDETGLLRPSARTDAGYRLYSRPDLERLQQVLFFRELGFPLDDIKRIMLDPAFERGAALKAQRNLLAQKARRATDMLAAVDTALEALEKGTQMDEKEMFEVFGDFDPKQYEDEVQRRWGDTDAYKESARRSRGYTKQDWLRIKSEGEANLARMIELFDAGVAPGDPRAMDTAEQARLQIDRDFYPCSYEMHVNLGEMYVADPRFTKHYDQHREGLAAWFRDAIKANSARADG